MVFEGDAVVPGRASAGPFVETALQVVPPFQGHVGLENVVEYDEIEFFASELHLVEPKEAAE